VAINATIKEKLRELTLRQFVILRAGLGNLHDGLRQRWRRLDGRWGWRRCGLRHGHSQRWGARTVRGASWCWCLFLIRWVFWKAVAWHAEIIASYI
jgi:hypothetical protein